MIHASPDKKYTLRNLTNSHLRVTFNKALVLEVETDRSYKKLEDSTIQIDGATTSINLTPFLEEIQLPEPKINVILYTYPDIAKIAWYNGRRDVVCGDGDGRIGPITGFVTHPQGIGW